MARVSVVVPNFNHARFLPQRMESVLGQTFGDLQVLVLDDASTDGSLDVLRQFATDPRVRTRTSDVNSGNPFVQWNRGVRETRGEYVWIAESDDFADPRLVASLVAVLDRSPNVGLAYCQSLTVDESGATTGTCADWTEPLAPGRWRADHVNAGRDEIRRFLLFVNTIFNASAVVFRRRAFERAGGADGTFGLCGDWMTWVRVLLVSDVAFVAEPLNRFRVHAGTVRASRDRDGSYPAEAYRVSGETLRALGADAALVEETCERRMAAWMQFARTASPSFAAHRRVYRAGLAVDPRLRRRLSKALVRQALHRMRLLDAVLAATGRVSSTRAPWRS